MRLEIIIKISIPEIRLNLITHFKLQPHRSGGSQLIHLPWKNGVNLRDDNFNTVFLNENI